MAAKFLPVFAEALAKLLARKPTQPVLSNVKISENFPRINGIQHSSLAGGDFHLNVFFAYPCLTRRIDTGTCGFITFKELEFPLEI